MSIEMEYRKTGTEALNTIVKDYNTIQLLESVIFDNSTNSESYKSLIYQTVGDLVENKTINLIIKNIEDKNIGWNHPSFDEMAANIAEQNDFIQNPFEVEEGIFECKAVNPKTGKICGSRRVFSYARQDRACDEGTSTYCQCVECKAQWRERG